jgi:hypothetical protein
MVCVNIKYKKPSVICARVTRKEQENEDARRRGSGVKPKLEGKKFRKRIPIRKEQENEDARRRGSGVKPKLEGKKFRKGIPMAATPMKKDYYSNVMAKFQMSLEEIVMHVQKQWEKRGADIAKGMRDLELGNTSLPHR